METTSYRHYVDPTQSATSSLRGRNFGLNSISRSPDGSSDSATTAADIPTMTSSWKRLSSTRRGRFWKRTGSWSNSNCPQALNTSSAAPISNLARVRRMGVSEFSTPRSSSDGQSTDLPSLHRRKEGWLRRQELFPFLIRRRRGGLPKGL